jgi:hypothetical protein
MDSKHKIGEGRYREVYFVNRGTCAKVLKPGVTKDYGFTQVTFPMRLYQFIKFGIRDFNRYELENYKMLKSVLPKDVRANFQEIYGVSEDRDGTSSICELVRNTDGSVSKSLEAHGAVPDKNFWSEFDNVARLLKDHDIYYFGISASNVLVREERGIKRPVFVDYKRIGCRTYPFQPWLILPGQRAEKLDRAIEKLESYRTK